MSALHKAVAQAIGDVQGERSFWADSAERRDERLAAAVIRVVLAEATRSIEEDIPDTTWQGGIPDTEVGRGREGMRDDVLAVIAALDAPPPL